MDKSVIVSVRLSEGELRKLQLLAQVYQRSVGELIRIAVGKEVEELTRSEEFKTRALELQKRNEETLNELLEVSGPIASDPKVVRRFPANVPGSNLSKLSVIESSRVGEVFSSLVGVEIVPTVGYAHFGAAASHKATPQAVTQRRFRLTWKQGEHEWNMEGFSAGKNQELVLSSTDGIQPSFITWRNVTTGESERLELTNSDDGRIIIRGISLAKALKRAEALRDAVDEAKRAEMLPTVYTAGEAR
jgi:hypothetical protein